ncbi:hypothetical protein ACIRBX_25600 [Kitasatospora sp. NPDC096147]|uniref:hypothetical protein n=1 Tax=Kitasatospora sp. NPDC096147 TaxID=3364093 RepID=UPI00380D68D7
MKLRALGVATTLAATAFLSIATGTAAEAAPGCGSKPAANGSRTATVDGPYQTYNLYKGPATSCGTTGATVKDGTGATALCAANITGTTWYYMDTPSGKGWISSANVKTYSGAPGNCA